MKFLIAILTTLLTQLAHASFIDSCIFTMEVTIVGELTPAGLAKPAASREVSAIVTATEDNGGHVGCQGHVGETHEMTLLSPALSHLVLLQAGQQIAVDYRFISSQTPTGIFTSKRYELKDGAQVSVNAIHQDPTVQAALGELQKELELRNGAYGKLLKVTADEIPGGRCGFAGCDTIYLVSLTYGDYPTTGTILAKVVVQPLNLGTSVVLINSAINE